MATLIPGQRTWRGRRSREGHRTYSIKYLVECNPLEGPSSVLQTPGLPAPGSVWRFDHDLDVWATCKLEAEAAIHEEREGDPATIWSVTQTFSTESDGKRCRDQQIEDPLLEPAKISGSFVKYNEEARYNRFGNPIVTSSFEIIRGPQVEFEKNRLTVRIEQNVASLYQAVALPAQMMDNVNSAPLWGLPKRTIKLSNGTFEKKFYGFCYSYYTRVLDFSVDFNTFDRDLLDEGTKALNGHWGRTGEWVLDNVNLVAPNRMNPQHYNQFKDRNGENCRVVLDGAGEPSGARQLGTATTIRGSTALSEGSFSFAPSAQPTTPIKLRLTITDADNSMNGGTVTIVGVNENNVTVAETFDLFFGTTDYHTQNKFKSVTSIFTTDMTQTPPGSGPDTILLETDDFVTDEGSVHVEYYYESDLLALGIPIAL